MLLQPPASRRDLRLAQGSDTAIVQLLQSGHCRTLTQRHADQICRGPLPEKVLGEAATVHVLCRTSTGERAYRGPRGLVIREDDSAAGWEGSAQMGPSGVDL